MAQLNLLLVFCEQFGLAFYYRKLAGNIPDVKTVKSLLADLEVLGMHKVKLVMDRGFYSADNINGLMKEHLKFLVGMRVSLNIVKRELESVYDSIRDFPNFDKASRIIKDAVEAQLLRPLDDTTAPRYMKYIPYWA